MSVDRMIHCVRVSLVALKHRNVSAFVERDYARMNASATHLWAHVWTF